MNFLFAVSWVRCPGGTPLFPSQPTSNPLAIPTRSTFTVCPESKHVTTSLLPRRSQYHQLSLGQWMVSLPFPFPLLRICSTVAGATGSVSSTLSSAGFPLTLGQRQHPHRVLCWPHATDTSGLFSDLIYCSSFAFP